MFSVFGQNGPFIGNQKGDNYTLNPHSWHKKYHMLYMDNPVDVGFSFTKDEGGYVRSGPEAAEQIYEFLTQFFSMFPHLRRNQFYHAGVSYGAVYAIETAHIIHSKNLEGQNVHINLTGVIVDSPWIDSYSQRYHGDQLHSFGLIGEKTKAMLKERDDKIQGLMDQGNFSEATKEWLELLQVVVPSITGYGAIYNAYNEQVSYIDATLLVTANSTRKALHVGNVTFKFMSPEQQERMQENMMKSSKPQLDSILKTGEYGVMIYVGNMDLHTGNVGIEKMLRSMEWEGANELATKARTIWKVDGKVAGYKARIANNNNNNTIEYVIIRNAGHGCLIDQPAVVLEAVQSFIEGDDMKMTHE